MIENLSIASLLILAGLGYLYMRRGETIDRLRNGQAQWRERSLELSRRMCAKQAELSRANVELKKWMEGIPVESDTLRLNWIENNEVATLAIGTDEFEHVILTPSGAHYGSSYREAVDNAMNCVEKNSHLQTDGRE